MNAIERFCQNSGRGCFAHASGSGKNISVGYAAAFNRVLQRACNVLLSHKLRERLGPPLPCNNLIVHGSLKVVSGAGRSQR